MEDFKELAELEIKDLKERVEKLSNENEQLKKVLKESGLDEEVPDIELTSIEEKICRNGIRHIALLVEAQDYTEKDIKNFDTLYRTLRTIQGLENSKPVKQKDRSTKELLKIVDKGI